MPFSETFPEIKDLRIEVHEYGPNILPNSGLRIYSKDNFPGEYIDCSNEFCFKGGFSIGDIIRRMVNDKQIDLRQVIMCQGNWASPKGKRKYRRCGNHIFINLHIELK